MMTTINTIGNDKMKALIIQWRGLLISYLISENEEDTVDYTVDEVINKIGFGVFQIRILVVCGLLWVSYFP